MFCIQCGGEIPAGSRFCPRCGRATPSSEGQGAPTGGPPSSPAPGPPTMPIPPPPPPPPSYGPGPPPGPYGAPPGAYGPPPGPYGAPPGAYGPPPGPYGAPPGAYGPPPGGYGAPPGAYGAYPPQYAGAPGDGPVAYGLASFGQRVGAFLVDLVIVWGLIIFGLIVLGITTPSPTSDNPNPGASGLGILVMLLCWFAGFAYPAIFEGRPDGQTLGKKAVGTRVVRKSNGGPLGYGLAIGRTLAKIPEGFTFGLGLLWAAWDPLHQTFHDKMAGTLVVRSSVYPPPGAMPPAGAPPGYRPQPPPPGSPYRVN